MTMPLPEQPDYDFAGVARHAGTPSAAVTIVKMFDDIDARAWANLDRHFHRDVVYERPGYPPFVGLDRLRTFYQVERVIASGQHHLTNAMADSRHGASWGVFKGTHRDGSPIDEAFADVYTFVDGLIIHRKSFFFRPAV